MAGIEDQPGTEPAAKAAPTTWKRRRGRPPTRPWERIEVTATILLIETLRRLGLQLALGDPLDEQAFRRQMTRHRVLPEFWDEMRSVMGRQRRYRDVVGLSPQGYRLVRVLTTRVDAGADSQAKALGRLWERQHGRRKAREINLSRMRGEPASSSATTRLPDRLMHLDGALDAWGAAEHRVSVKTFQRWRRLAVAADAQRPEGERLLARLQRPEQPRAKRHRPA